MTIFNYNCSECDKPFRSEHAIGPPAFCLDCVPNQPKWMIIDERYNTEKITINNVEYEIRWASNCNGCLKHYYAVKEAVEECVITQEIDNENSRYLMYDMEQHIYHKHENHVSHLVICSDCRWYIFVNDKEDAVVEMTRHNAEKGHNVGKGAAIESNVPTTYDNQASK